METELERNVKITSFIKHAIDKEVTRHALNTGSISRLKIVFFKQAYQFIMALPENLHSFYYFRERFECRYHYELTLIPANIKK